jgi:hypothetical protein
MNNKKSTVCPTRGHAAQGHNSSFNLGATGGWVVNAISWLFYVQERYLVPMYRRLGGPNSQSGQVRKILPPRGFKPQTTEPL